MEKQNDLSGQNDKLARRKKLGGVGADVMQAVFPALSVWIAIPEARAEVWQYLTLLGLYALGLIAFLVGATAAGRSDVSFWSIIVVMVLAVFLMVITSALVPSGHWTVLIAFLAALLLARKARNLDGFLSPAES